MNAASRSHRLRHCAEQLAAPLPPLLVAAERVAATVAQGVHGRRRVGSGETFWQFRRYQSGDPAAAIDWRQSAKSQRLFVRETEWEAAQSVWLWRDASPSMRYRSRAARAEKIERASLLALALAVLGIDDFASIAEVVGRRYRRLQQEEKPLPGLVLVDGGIGQLHAAAQALEQLGIINQPLAAIAKREETIFVAGQEDEPIQLERFSPVLHLVQMIRDEAHRFAVRFHRSRRHSRQLTSALLNIPGVGARTVQKLLRNFGSLEHVRGAGLEELSSVVNQTQAHRIQQFLAHN